ncbi:unnamed protein product [Heterobilharzia americana]|nr:unnamed protein product [Heterobilharzia americana]
MRAILALHDLISNKLTNRETERNEEGSGGNTESKKTLLGSGDQNKRTAQKHDGSDDVKLVDSEPKSNDLESSKKKTDK